MNVWYTSSELRLVILNANRSMRKLSILLQHKKTWFIHFLWYTKRALMRSSSPPHLPLAQTLRQNWDKTANSRRRK